MLYEVCTRFASFDLGPESVSDRMMTDIYEHLIQRYGEEISQDAENFITPKDVTRLATASLGGMLTSICTWSGMRCPSITSTPL